MVKNMEGNCLSLSCGISQAYSWDNWGKEWIRLSQYSQPSDC